MLSRSKWTTQIKNTIALLSSVSQSSCGAPTAIGHMFFPEMIGPMLTNRSAIVHIGLPIIVFVSSRWELWEGVWIEVDRVGHDDDSTNDFKLAMRKGMHFSKKFVEASVVLVGENDWNRSARRGMLQVEVPPPLIWEYFTTGAYSTVYTSEDTNVD